MSKQFCTFWGIKRKIFANFLFEKYSFCRALFLKENFVARAAKFADFWELINIPGSNVSNFEIAFHPSYHSTSLVHLVKNLRHGLLLNSLTTCWLRRNSTLAMLLEILMAPWPPLSAPKEIDFPLYNIKCSGGNVILRGIFHVVLCCPLHLYVISRKFELLFGQWALGVTPGHGQLCVV